MIKINLRILLGFLFLVLTNCKKDDGPMFEACNAPEKVFVGHMRIGSQEGLEKFGANNYTKIEGSLRLFEVENLKPLNCLQEVTGFLSVGYMDCIIDQYGECNGSWPKSNPKLKSLSGLDNLKIVGGTLTLVQNDIKNLKGLYSLDSVGGLFVFWNDNLNDFCELKNVEILTEYTVTQNGYNPIKQQLKTDACKAN